MRVRFDEQADALYVRLDKRGEVIGIEILRVGERLPTAELRHIEFDVIKPSTTRSSGGPL